jgi:hypothetical protein
MLIDFMSCLEGDFSVLGKGTQEEQYDAWNLIWAEFCEKTGNHAFMKLVRIMKENTILSSKLMAIDICLKVLVKKYSAECIEILKKYGYEYSYPQDDRVAFLDDLMKVRSKSKILHLQLKNNEQEYERLKKEAEENKQTEFTESLVAVSKYMGYRINPKETTTLEYIGMVKMIEKESKKVA